MAPLLSEEEAALDPYHVLELANTASEQEIKKAYRKMSLKYHPDKNSTPEGAIMFRKITVSLDILSDNAKRNFLDTRLESDRRKKEKYGELDKKRKEMVDALNARETDAKKARVAQVQKRKQEADEESIKEAGRRMLEEAQKRAAAASAASAASSKAAKPTPTGSTTNGTHSNASTPKTSSHGASSQPRIEPIDLTLILTLAPTFSESSSLLQNGITGRYGPISHLILKDPPAAGEGEKKKKKPKGRRAIVEFESGNWGGCWACWKDHQSEESSRGLGGGIKAKWGAGSEPEWVSWAEKQAKDGRGHQAHSHANGDGSWGGHSVSDDNVKAPTFGSAPDLGGITMADLLAQHQSSKQAERDRKAKEDEFESMTLFRMRQMERERLAEQIRREEEEGE